MAGRECIALLCDSPVNRPLTLAGAGDALLKLPATHGVIKVLVRGHSWGSGVIASAVAGFARVCQLARPFQSHRCDDGLIQDCPQPESGRQS